MKIPFAGTGSGIHFGAGSATRAAVRGGLTTSPPRPWWWRVPSIFAEDAPSGGVPTFSTVAWLAAGMAFATLPFVGRIPWWLLAFVIMLGMWRMYLAWYARPSPSSAIRHVMSLGALVGLWVTGNVGFGLDAAAPLFVVFLWIKLFELDGERDVLMASFLGFFLITGVLLTGQSLILTMQALSAAIMLLTGIWWYNSPHLGGTALIGIASGAALPPPVIPRLKSPLREAWRVLGKILLLLAQALPFAILLFLFTPRPVIQLSINSRNAMAGISDHLDPGKFAANTKNEQVAFRAEFPNHDMPNIDDLYWRGVVLWQTDGNAWQRGPEAVPSPTGWVTQALSDTTASGRVSEHISTHGVVQDITQPASPNPWLYTLDTPVAQIGDAMLLPGLVSEWRDGPTGTSTYRVLSNPALRPADWSPYARRYGLQMPLYVDPRIQQLASELKQGATTVDEVVERTVQWFIQQHFVYTLEPGEMGNNATATFLFEKRKGFCGHYAAAFSTLMRTAGIPARVVMGYRGGEINPQGGFLVVRQNNAHAWAEVWTGDRLTGWQRVDLTSVIPASDPLTGQATATTAAQATNATSRAQQRAKRPWLEQMAFRTRTTYEYIESRWDRWAVGYNSELQDQFLSWLGLDGFGGWAHVIGLASGGLVVIFSIALTTWLSPRLLETLNRSREERAYHRLLASCARAGMPRLSTEGPQAHAGRVARRLPAAAEALSDGVNGWLDVRYGVPGRARHDVCQRLLLAAKAVRLAARLAVRLPARPPVRQAQNSAD